MSNCVRTEEQSTQMVPEASLISCLIPVESPTLVLKIFWSEPVCSLTLFLVKEWIKLYQLKLDHYRQ